MARAMMVGASRTAGGGSGFATVLAGDGDETVESEPNDAADAATPLALTPALPTAVSGRLEAAGDVDFYKLALRKGQRVSFRGRTRSLGVPCDLVMRLHAPDGKRIGQSKVEGPADAELDATAPEDGTYTLRVAEIAGAGGPGLAYRVEVMPQRAGFALSVEADKVDAKPGGEFELKVTCVRRDFGGAIALSVEGFEPASLAGATIAAGKTEATLKVKVPSGLEGGRVVHFVVVGTARVGDGEFQSVASTGPALKKLFPRMLYPPATLDGSIALGVRGEPGTK
jgi:hypothetical protein